ncbi:MAG: hypothetical protein KGZ52_02740 [Xanthomonadaceae bacterium]|nr:hypothetical protein [Xanthomonadaceae bacterium]
MSLQIGQRVAIRPPFGDGTTPRLIEDAMAINAEGEPAIGAQIAAGRRRARDHRPNHPAADRPHADRRP